MDNNLKNKTMFFAQYWGQRVFVGHVLEEVNSSYIDPMYDTSILELKPLEDITDDDLMTIAKHYEPTTYKVESNSDEIVFDYMYGDNFSSAAIGYDYGYALDYLRSKGYALPWMGLSVEKQIQYGWVKLKEKSDGK